MTGLGESDGTMVSEQEGGITNVQKPPRSTGGRDRRKIYNVTEREHVVPERGLDHNARGVGKSHGARGGGSHNNTLAATPASFCLYVHLR